MPGRPPIISVVGRSGAGKTTVLEVLIAELAQRGLRVGVLKHSAHAFELDHEGKDTWRHRCAGAVAVGIMSADQVAVMRSLQGELPLEQAATLLGGELDVILTEGFRHPGALKIEVARVAVSSEIETPAADLLAVVSDFPAQTTAPRFTFAEAGALADVIAARIANKP